MAIEFLCRKVGMTQVFSDSGESIPVTILEAGPNRVVQKKTDERDGYTALQLGMGERRASRMTKGEVGHFEKAGVSPAWVLRESRIPAEEADQYEVGQEIQADIFNEGQKVDVIGTSKGRGTAGVVKRHGFAVKRRTHGTHEFFRHGGAIGAGAYPGKVFKGMKMPGRMGNDRVTTQNVEVVKVDAGKGLLYVRGGVPGHPNAVLQIRAAKKA